MNFNYTYTGPDQYAPTRIYDDGSSTYFQFRPSDGPPPAIFGVRPDGQEVLLETHISQGSYVVPVVIPRFTIRQPNGVICVYNENARATMARQ